MLLPYLCACQQQHTTLSSQQQGVSAPHIRKVRGMTKSICVSSLLGQSPEAQRYISAGGGCVGEGEQGEWCFGGCWGGSGIVTHGMNLLEVEYSWCVQLMYAASLAVLHCAVRSGETSLLLLNLPCLPVHTTHNIHAQR